MPDANCQAREITIEAVVIRADGTRQDLGTVAYWHANPLRRLMHSLRQTLTQEN